MNWGILFSRVFWFWVALYDLVMLPIVVSVILYYYSPNWVGLFVCAWIALSVVLAFMQAWTDLVYKVYRKTG